jgi:hypothetical protein
MLRRQPAPELPLILGRLIQLSARRARHLNGIGRMHALHRLRPLATAVVKRAALGQPAMSRVRF